MNNIDLRKQFHEYFNELEGFGLRSERCYADLAAARPEVALIIARWMEAAFIQGARTMAQDTIDTLADYGTATAGIDEMCYNRTQAFDAAGANLLVYYTQILQEAERES